MVVVKCLSVDRTGIRGWFDDDCRVKGCAAREVLLRRGVDVEVLLTVASVVISTAQGLRVSERHRPAPTYSPTRADHFVGFCPFLCLFALIVSITVTFTRRNPQEETLNLLE